MGSFLLLLTIVGSFNQYQVVGRALPAPSEEHSKNHRLKLCATIEVKAKSKFWCFPRKTKKVKKSNDQVLAINEFHLFISLLSYSCPKDVYGSDSSLRHATDTMPSLPSRHNPAAVSFSSSVNPLTAK
ncbi:hypothetical protein KFK09_018674 [Dendrobium nobile]|uniref:Secreted protein n=1 Tax=Dendrobium nobile TaxID=94219 RepID=A0A8T3AXQ8_DENNO|nr:hypothetical protein KFK09_018674 [Dendrobium nobile]